MIEAEEVTKIVDGVYKGLLDKFNPTARQLVTAGKQYLKALHGAAAASKLYTEAIFKLALQAQQGTWGATGDVGGALMEVGEVYRDIQAQQLNILKAFYVDLLVPLEANIEKDTKVVQTEQKKFLAEHKKCLETYNKAAAAVRKDKKKHRTSKSNSTLDKELKHMQILEEEKEKLDAFCEESLKNAFHQERRRYGFVLERQCSLAKHTVAFHKKGQSAIQKHLEDWQDLAKGRDSLPENIRHILEKQNQEDSFNGDDTGSISSQLRKTKSMDASCLELATSNNENFGLGMSATLPRARSELNLSGSSSSINKLGVSSRPKSIAVVQEPPMEQSLDSQQLARAVYSYLSSGVNQLSFIEGDMILLIGERNKGWQYGENSRTQRCGWFPVAYTQLVNVSPQPSSPRSQEQTTSGIESGPSSNSSNSSNPHLTTFQPQFGDSLLARVTLHDKIYQDGTREPPPPPPPPTIPAPVSANRKGNISLHSSNDSGFHNDVNAAPVPPPPAAPDVDYSDEEQPSPTESKPFTAKPVKGWLLLHSARNSPMPQKASPIPSVTEEDPFPAPTMPAPCPMHQDRDDTLLLKLQKAKSPKPLKRSKSLLQTITNIIKKDSVYKPNSVQEEVVEEKDWNHLDMVSVDEKVQNWNCLPNGNQIDSDNTSDKEFEKFLHNISKKPEWDHTSIVQIQATNDENEKPKAQGQTPVKSHRSRSSSAMKTKERVNRRHSSVSDRSLQKQMSAASRSYEDISQFFSNPLTVCQSRINEKQELESKTSEDNKSREWSVPHNDKTVAPTTRMTGAGNCFHPDWIFWTRDGKQISSLFKGDTDIESIMLLSDHTKSLDRSNCRNAKILSEYNKYNKASILKNPSSISSIGSGSQSVRPRRNKRPHPRAQGDLFNYGAIIQKRLYSSERESVLDQKSATGNMCGKWHDLWQKDKDGSVKILC